MARPTRRIPNANLGRKWVGADAGWTYFENGSARWAGVFVRADPNGDGQTKWVAPLELLLYICTYIHYCEHMHVQSVFVSISEKLSRPATDTFVIYENFSHSTCIAKKFKINLEKCTHGRQV